MVGVLLDERGYDLWLAPEMFSWRVVPPILIEKLPSGTRLAHFDR